MATGLQTPVGLATPDPDARVTLVRLCIIGFLAYCSYAMCRTPMLPLLASELGATPPLVGLVVGASTLTGIVIKLPAGALSDLVGRRPLLIAAAIVFTVMPFTYFGATSLAALIAIRFVHGSATAIFGPVASAMLSDMAPIARRATWLSTYSTIQGVGQAIGPIIAGYLIAARRYDLAFVVAGAFALVTPALSATLSPSRRRELPTGGAAEVVRGISEVGRHPLILMTSVAQAAQFVLNGTLNAFLPLFARDVIGMAASDIGWLFACQVVTTLAARPLMGAVSDRVGRRHVIASGIVLCSLGVVLVSWAHGLPTLIAAIMIYAAGAGFTTAATGAFITDLSRRARYGAAHGVFGTIYDVGDALGPILAGVLVGTLGYASMFRVIALVAFASAIVFHVMARRGQD
jgi:DHA1 family multidrug resistance protein-like MFS transporter